jgi:hypothetical protein
VGTPFVDGKKAFGFCDVCAQRYPLKKLKFVVVKQRITSTLACPECWDKDHPQLMLGVTPVNDPQALRNPRPDTSQTESRDIQWGWMPVGGGSSGSGTPNALVASSGLGTVTVSTP